MPERRPNLFLRFLRRSRRQAETTFYGTPAVIDDPEPIYITQRTRSLLILGVLIVLIWLMIQLPNLVQIFALGATLALVLSFPTRFLNRFVSRGKSIAIVTIGMILLAFLSLAAVIPFLINEITQFTESFPSLAEDGQDLLRSVLQWFYNRGLIDTRPDTVIANMQDSIFTTAQSMVDDLAARSLTFLTSSVGLLITTFGVIFVAIYLLADIPRFRESYVRMWAQKYRSDAAALWDTIGYSLSRYLAGLLVSLTLQGVLVMIGLSILNVPYAVVLGLLMSSTAIIPYVGAFIAGGPGVAVALTVSWPTGVAALLLYLSVNILDGNFITPRIQGSAVRVHPLLIFFAVIAGSTLFGPFGAILGVPVLAILRVVGEFFWLRLRVKNDSDTMLSVMRNDTVQERLDTQTPIAEQTSELEEELEPTLEGQPSDDIRTFSRPDRE